MRSSVHYFKNKGIKDLAREHITASLICTLEILLRTAIGLPASLHSNGLPPHLCGGAAWRKIPRQWFLASNLYCFSCREIYGVISYICGVAWRGVTSPEYLFRTLKCAHIKHFPISSLYSLQIVVSFALLWAISPAPCTQATTTAAIHFIKEWKVGWRRKSKNWKESIASFLCSHRNRKPHACNDKTDKRSKTEALLLLL